MSDQKLTQEQIIDEIVQKASKVEQKFMVKRQDTPIGRVYRHEDEDTGEKADIYSVTTILNVIDKGIGFNKWLGNSPSYEIAMDYANERAEIGTMVHAFCSLLSWNMEVDTANGWEDRNHVKHNVPDEAKKRLLAFIDYFKAERPIMISSEIMLFNPLIKDTWMQYPFAGTADMTYMTSKDNEAQMVMCDIKTGKEHPKLHALQLTAYKILWDSLYGEEQGKIDVLKVLYLRSNGKYKLVEYPYVPDAFYECVSLFEYMNTTMKTGKWPTIKDKVDLPTIFSLDMELENE